MRRPSTWLHWFAAIVAFYPWALVLMSAAHVLAPARNGPLALTEVFAPHLFLGIAVLVPIATRVPSRLLRAGVAVALLVGLIRFGPGVISLAPNPISAEETQVTVLSWNLEVGQPAIGTLRDVLLATDADIVALQELTPSHAAAIEADTEIAARFPGRRLIPAEGVAGIGVLSRWPITDWKASTGPVVLRAAIDPGNRNELTIINAHPYPPGWAIGPVVPLPLRYGATTRDADILRIRQQIDRDLAAGQRVIVVGDFNLTDREPAYADLAKGLWDAHREVGFGTGSTWRPGAMEALPLGILRIDHVFGGPGTRPLAIGEDCAPRNSDHCIVRAVLALR